MGRLEKACELTHYQHHHVEPLIVIIVSIGKFVVLYFGRVRVQHEAHV